MPLSDTIDATDAPDALVRYSVNGVVGIVEDVCPQLLAALAEEHSWISDFHAGITIIIIGVKIKLDFNACPCQSDLLFVLVVQFRVLKGFEQTRF
jgi:hypothetical protein